MKINLPGNENFTFYQRVAHIKTNFLKVKNIFTILINDKNSGTVDIHQYYESQ